MITKPNYWGTKIARTISHRIIMQTLNRNMDTIILFQRNVYSTNTEGNTNLVLENFKHSS